ncbi:restriction endonuclease subunit S [Limimaricola soesokkakensis]|uniref:restriction endonuclease subunit S n=1 Tax=Limimaricola soesokkakensis TaxID=1343159 RepID=UPI003515E9CB
MSWDTVELASVADINPRMPKGLSGDLEVSFLPMAAVSEDGQIDYQEERTLEKVRKGYTYFQRGDVLVAKITPCFENGKATKTDALDEEHGFGSTEFHVIRGNPNELLPEYAFHLVWNPFFRKEGAANMTGSAGQKRVPADFLKRLKIPLPPLEEQRRIAGILDAADALRRRRRAALALLETLPEAIFAEMFGDRLSKKDGEPNFVPLSAIAHIQSGITKGRKLKPDQEAYETPYLAVANVQDKRLDLNNVKTIEATEKERERYALAVGDLLLTEGGDPDKLGRGTVWNDEFPGAIHQNHIFRVRVTDEKVLPVFLSHLLSSPHGRGYFLRMAKQTTGIASINKTQLSEFPVFLPEEYEQVEFTRRLQSYQAQKDRYMLHLAHLESGFASLQSRAFAGEL